MSEISVKIEEDDISSALLELMRHVSDMSDAMQAIAGTLEDSIEEAFDQEADPVSGTPWPDLAEDTIKQRARTGTWPGKMLQISQAGLASSIDSGFGPDFAVAGPAGKFDYAAIHHFGGQAGKNLSVTIPARPYLGLTQDHKKEVLSIIRRHITLASIA